MAAARKCASSRIVQPYPAATSDVGRSGSQTRSASQAPCGRAPEDVLDGRPHPAELADPVTFGKRREHRLVVGAAEDLDLVAFDQRAETVDRIGSFGDQPIEQGPRVVERQPDVRVPLERIDHRRVGLLEDLREDPAEVPDRLMVVECERQRDARRRHDRQPASVTSGSSGGAATSMPAAGR